MCCMKCIQLYQEKSWLLLMYRRMLWDLFDTNALSGHSCARYSWEVMRGQEKAAAHPRLPSWREYWHTVWVEEWWTTVCCHTSLRLPVLRVLLGLNSGRKEKDSVIDSHPVAIAWLPSINTLQAPPLLYFWIIASTKDVTNKQNGNAAR